MKDYHQRAGGLPGAGHQLRQAGNQVSLPSNPGGHDRRGELYLRILRLEIRDHRRLAAARRQEPCEWGETGRRDGNGPVPEEGVASQLLPAASEAGINPPKRMRTRVVGVGRRTARQTGKASPRQLRMGESDSERNRPNQAEWFILRPASIRQ